MTKNGYRNSTHSCLRRLGGRLSQRRMAMRLYGSIASDHLGPDGIEVVSRIRERNPKQAIAVVAAYESRAQSIRHRSQIPMLPISFPQTQLVKLVESVTKPKLRMLLVAGDFAISASNS